MTEIRRPARFSQCLRILLILEDGQPHLMSELQAISGLAALNSRITELRKRGYAVEHVDVDGKYGYQLISDGADESTGRSQSLPLVPATVPSVASPSEQLQLVGRE